MSEIQEVMANQELERGSVPFPASECDETKAAHDNVHNPGHYTFGEIEVIDYIRDKLSPEAFEGFCIGNVLKYVSRYTHKNGSEDLEKAKVYLNWGTDTVKKREDEEIYSVGDM